MADDAGALLVRSGLVSSNALDDARARVASVGGTVGEQLVTSGAIGDEDLTDFYRSRLLVPQVNPNLLARLTPSVVATIPGDMAIELRAIPVSIDSDNNLTVAMSDPSDRHAVDEIAFFTGAYVVRAVATQMQIAWCLAHYYGHVTALGQRLLRVTPGEAARQVAAAPRPPRTKGLTGKVNATRHRAIAPVTGPIDMIRPSSGQLDLRPLEAAAAAAPAASPASGGANGGHARVAEPFLLSSSASAGRPAAPAGPIGAGDSADLGPALTVPGVIRPNPLMSANLASARSGAAAATSAPAPSPGVTDAPPTIPFRSAGASGAASLVARATEAAAPVFDAAPRPTVPGVGVSPPNPPAAAAPPSVFPAASPDSPTLMPGAVTDEISAPTITIVDEASAPVASPVELLPPPDAAPEKPRARSVSGEIRVPVRRAPSIRPMLPQPDLEDDEDPLIMIEMREEDDETGRRALPLRRRPIVKSDPPELQARAGEVDLPAGADRAIDVDEPRIVIDEDALAPETGRIERRAASDARPTAPITAIVIDDAEAGAVIHDRVVDRAPAPGSESPEPSDSRDSPDSHDDEDPDTGEIDVVMLDAPKKPRPERRTQIGVGPVPAATRPRDDGAVPAPGEAHETERTAEADDATSVDLAPAPLGEDTSSDLIAAPPAPASDADTNPHLLAAPPAPAPAAARGGQIPRAVIVEDDDDGDSHDDDEGSAPRGPHTSEMSAAELDDAIPDRASELPSEPLLRRWIEHDAVDDGWGPPGTTIPPPLLGAIPGSEDEGESSGAIPMPNVDSSPLIVAAPSLPAPGEPSGRALVRALEDATARAIEVIRQLEHTASRDDVVGVMISYLAETHHRAGFFVTRHAVSRDAGELALFAIKPKLAAMPAATLRLDRGSTLQDVVNTRLPYRGPMHDDVSRQFLVSVLGACPAEILLVPVTVRERVVGVLFGEHRLRHTFDDQLALAARASGMALERILRARRG